MKKTIITIVLITISIVVNAGFNKDPKDKKNSNNFKKITKTYENQKKIFFLKAFELNEVGDSIFSHMNGEMDEAIYQAFLSDFGYWAKSAKKHQGSKKFKLKTKAKKGYETEKTEYVNQFRLIQTEFVNLRFVWDEKQLQKTLTKEVLYKYILPVRKKFEDKTKKFFANTNK